MISKDEITPANATTYVFDEFRLEAENLLLLRNSEVVPLAPKAAEVLLALAAANGKLITKQEILNLVWADTFVEEANLTHHISALRKALGEDKNGRKFIETIPRRGYRFIPAVFTSDNGAAEIVIEERTQTRLVEEETIELPETCVEPPETFLPALTDGKKSRKWRTTAFAALAVAAFAVAGYITYKSLNPAPVDFKIKKTTRLTVSGRVKAAAISPDGKFVIYVQEEFDDRQTLRRRHIGSESDAEIAAPNVKEFRSLALSPDGNQIYFVNENLTLYQMPVLGGTAKRVAELVNSAVALAPDGRQIAFVRRFGSDGSQLFIVDANGGGERQLASFDNSTPLWLEPAWSPDGKVIACPVFISEGANILVFQVSDGVYAKVLPEPWSYIKSLAWSLDSQSLLATGKRKTEIKTDREPSAFPIWRISYSSGEAQQITADSSDYNNLHLTAHNNFLMAVKSETAAQIHPMLAGTGATAVRRLTAGIGKQDGISAIGWLPNGEIFYSSKTSAAIWIRSAEGDRSRLAIKDAAEAASSPDGRYLVYLKYQFEPDKMGLWRIDLNNGEEEKLTLGRDVYPTFSPDGKWVVFTRIGKVRNALLKVSSSGGEPTAVYNKFVIGAAVSPDGKTIAFDDIGISFVEFESGKLIKKLSLRPGRFETSDFRKLQWTADGRGVYFISRTNSVSNIWRQPIDDSAPVQVTNFEDGRIFNFAFSPDYSQIALSRGTVNSDVVLIENTQ